MNQVYFHTHFKSAESSVHLNVHTECPSAIAQQSDATALQLCPLKDADLQLRHCLIITHSPYRVVLHVLGIQAGIKVNHRLEGPEVAVEEQQQQFELSVGGAVRQTLLQEPQALKHHGLVTYRRCAHTHS